MYVPNYIPEPLEVPGNITLAPYGLRVRFIGVVTALHLASLGCVVGIALLPWRHLSAGYALALLAIPLVVLDVLRIGYRGRPIETLVSVAALPVVLLSAGWAARSLQESGIPVGCILAGPVCAGIYTIGCRRDYSFCGCGFLSLIVSTVALAAYAMQVHMPVGSTRTALALNAAYLIYFVYDLASLMARRRRGEELAAVVDLYRDVFNIFGYVVRVIGHWKKHRIWVTPRG